MEQVSEKGSEPVGFARETFLGLLRTGLWPNAALGYLGVTREEWRRVRETDRTLRADMAKSIAAFEMIHVRNLHTKIQEANDWRGSAWWLAQRFPERYGGGRQTRDIEKAVEEVVESLDQALKREFQTPDDLRRLAKVFSNLGDRSRK